MTRRDVRELDAEADERQIDWTREPKEKGRKKGLEKGRREGRREGRAKMLLLISKRRFGRIPDSVQERVVSADLEDIDRWAKRLLEASSREDVFGE